MAKVFATEPGVEIRVGNYGTATEAEGVVIPDSLADEIAAIPSLRVVRGEETKPANPETKAPRVETIAPKTETKPAKGEKE